MKLIKKVQSFIEEANKKCIAEMKECEMKRHTHLTQIGNFLHPSVPISDNEVCKAILMKSTEVQNPQSVYNVHVHKPLIEAMRLRHQMHNNTSGWPS